MKNRKVSNGRNTATKYSRKICGVCMAVLLALLLAACGGGNTSGSAAGNAGEASEKTEDAEKQETEAAANVGDAADADAAGSAQEAAGAGELAAATDGADHHGFVINVTGIETYDSYLFVNYDITNNSGKETGISLYPILINGQCAYSEGTSENIPAGETISQGVAISTDVLQTAGLSGIHKVEGYFYTLDENYYQATETELVLLADDGSAADEGIEASGDVMYDEDGIRITYQGSLLDGSGYSNALFLVSNNTEEGFNVGLRDTWKVEGGTAGVTKLMAEGGTVPAGKQAVVKVTALDGETYSGASYETADIELVVSSVNTFPKELPIHLKAEGDAITAAADEAYYSEETKEYMAMLGERAEKEQKDAEREAEREANAEEAQDPVIEETAIYNYKVGTTSNGALVTVMVSNPNERTILYDLRMECMAYDADGNEIKAGTKQWWSNSAIRPGETLPFIFSVNQIDLDTTVDHVDLNITGCKSLNEYDLAEKEDSLILTADDIHLDSVLVEDHGPETARLRNRAWIYGNLVNEGETVEKATMLVVLYDTDGKVIAADRFNLDADDLPGGETTEYDCNFQSVQEMPGYDHAEIFILK